MFVAVFLAVPLTCIDTGRAQESSPMFRQAINPGDPAYSGSSQETVAPTDQYQDQGQTVFTTPDGGAGLSADLTSRDSNASGVATRPIPGQTNSAQSTQATSGLRSNTNTQAFKVLPQSQVGTPDANGQLNTRSNVAAATIEGGGATTDSNPYKASGIRLGTFDLFPTLEQSVGYTDNADFINNGSSAGFSETTAGLRLQSNWSRHQAQAELGATYQKFFNGDREDLPAANASGSLRLDIGADYTLTVDGAYNLTTENPSSANLATGSTASVVDRPTVHQQTSSLEIAKVQGKLQFSLRGSLDQTQYDDASLSDGSKLLQRDRDNLLSMVTGRVSYEISSAVSPFIEASTGRRTYEIRIDRNGNRRDGTLYVLRGGLELNFSEKLSGQISIGQMVESFKDPKINTLDTLALDGFLIWSPQRLTTVTTTAKTTLVPSANIDDNGSVIYSGKLGISRQVRQNLTLDGNLTASLEDYDTSGRRDVRLGANAGYTYWFNRFVATTGKLSYQNVDSSEAGSSYDVGTVRLGLRFQR